MEVAAPWSGFHEMSQHWDEQSLDGGGIFGSKRCAHHPGVHHVRGEDCLIGQRCGLQRPGQLVGEQDIGEFGLVVGLGTGDVSLSMRVGRNRDPPTRLRLRERVPVRARRDPPRPHPDDSRWRHRRFGAAMIGDSPPVPRRGQLLVSTQRAALRPVGFLNGLTGGPIRAAQPSPRAGPCRHGIAGRTGRQRTLQRVAAVA
jgi:hypothetical protein